MSGAFLDRDTLDIDFTDEAIVSKFLELFLVATFPPNLWLY